MIRVVVADDSCLIRESLRRLLCSGDELCVIAEAANGKEALLQVEEGRPDVLVIDLHMPTMDGLEVLNALKGARGLTPAVIVITCDPDEKYRSLALSLGAFAFVAKEDLGDLPELVREAAWRTV